MKVLVTGGAGFIGSHIADGLILQGHEVVIVDNLSSGKKENLNPEAKFYRIDIRDKGLKEVFEKENPSVVCHHAAQIDVRKSVMDPGYDAEVNILGSLNILESSRGCGVKKIIFASSGGVMYGECDSLPASEDFPAQPISPYGVAKRAVELYLGAYHANYGIKSVALRYANVYGPRQDPHGEAGVVAIFTMKMLNGENPVIFGDGEQLRDYVSVDDVVRANLLALKTEKNGIYNIGTGAGTSVNGLFKLLAKWTGFKSSAEYGPYRQGELKKNYLNSEKALKELGWAPSVVLEEGLKKTVEYFLEKRKLD